MTQDRHIWAFRFVKNAVSSPDGLAFPLKKAFQHLGRLNCKQAFFYPDSMVQQLRIAQTKDTAQPAKSNIARGKNHSLDSRVHKRAGAHRARLQSDVQRAARKTIIPRALRGHPNGIDFGVGGWIARRDRPIPSFAGNGALENQHCAHRNLAFRFGFSRQVKGLLHPDPVVGRPGIRKKCLNLGIQALVSYGTLKHKGCPYVSLFFPGFQEQFA